MKTVKQFSEKSEGIPENFLVDVVSYLKERKTDSSKIRGFINRFGEISGGYEERTDENNKDLLRSLVEYVEEKKLLDGYDI